MSQNINNTTALTLFNDNTGMVALRDFKHKKQATLKVEPFKAWHCRMNEVSLEDKGAVKELMGAARGNGELRSDYHDYRRNMTNQIAALRSEAMRGLEYEGVQVKVDKVTGKVVNYQEKYAEVITPRSLVPRATVSDENTKLKADLATLKAQLAALQVPAIEDAVDVSND
jgi:hypothetical protein